MKCVLWGRVGQISVDIGLEEAKILAVTEAYLRESIPQSNSSGEDAV